MTHLINFSFKDDKYNMKVIEPLTPEDRFLLITNKNKMSKLLLLFCFSVFVLIIIFGWKYAFSTKSLDRIIIWSFALVPVLLSLVYYLFQQIDLIIGKKRLITGVVENVISNVAQGKTGSNTTLFYFVVIDGKQYSISQEFASKCVIGEKFNISRTLFSKLIFAIKQH